MPWKRNNVANQEERSLNMNKLQKRCNEKLGKESGTAVWSFTTWVPGFPRASRDSSHNAPVRRSPDSGRMRWFRFVGDTVYTETMEWPWTIDPQWLLTWPRVTGRFHFAQPQGKTQVGPACFLAALWPTLWRNEKETRKTKTIWNPVTSNPHIWALV